MRLLLTSIILLALSCASFAAESLFSIAVKDIDGRSTTLAPYKGRVLLIVNVASECGYTTQYRGLEAVLKNIRRGG